MLTSCCWVSERTGSLKQSDSYWFDVSKSSSHEGCHYPGALFGSLGHRRTHTRPSLKCTVCLHSAGTKAYLSSFHFLEDSITTPCFTNLLHPSGAMSTGFRCRSYSSFSSRAARRTPNPRRIIHVHLSIYICP